jgi:general secretion pathway protein D
LGSVSAPPASGASHESDGPRVTADEVNNAIVIYATATEYRNLQETLLRLDVPPMQVMLEAAIAEVDLNNELSFGIQYSFQDSHNQLSTIANAAVTSTAPGLAYSFTLGKSIKATLDALATVTNVKVISAPKVLVLNNQPAKLEVGDDVPITTQSSQSTLAAGSPIVNSVEYRETGVILQVTPRVNQGGLVQMDVSQEVSNVAQTSSSAISPSFTQRKISSTVSVQDGETIALGGLITDSRSKIRNVVPFLNQIPYLGQLFSQKDNTAARTELLVLITPHVVQSVQRLRVITDELRRHMGEVQQLLDH